MEREKIRVASHNMGSPAAYGKLQEFVVLGIAASRNPNINIYPLCFARQNRNEGPDVLFVDIFSETFSTQNFAQLGKHRKREQQLSAG